MQVSSIRPRPLTFGRHSVLFAIAWWTFLVGSAQALQFSSTQDYRSMLEELHHDPVRPSRMSAGTMLSQTSQRVRVRADDEAQALQLTTDTWQLRIAKDRWGLRLLNKRTGISRQLGGTGDNNAGITWQEQSAATSPNSKRLSVLIPVTQKPREVKLGGEPLSETVVSATRQRGWQLDSETQMLRLTFEARDFDLHVTK